MPRHPDGDQPRTERLSLRLTTSEFDAVDTSRGVLTRSAYIRALIEAETTREVPE